MAKISLLKTKAANKLSASKGTIRFSPLVTMDKNQFDCFFFFTGKLQDWVKVSIFVIFSYFKGRLRRNRKSILQIL